MLEFNNFEAIQIRLASPEKIRSWSKGEVKKPETINYRTLKPERDGLFCERIFGPTKDWECHCGKYKRIRFKGIVCDRCGVEVTTAKVRRERMGHIELAAPVSHIWYFKGSPSRLALMLNISPSDLEKVLYFAAYIVIDPGKTDLVKKQILSEKEYREHLEKFGDIFRAGMGAEAIKELLTEIDVNALVDELREEAEVAQGQKKVRLVKRLEVAEAFKQSGNRPEWMILDVIPVSPPEIRPMVQLDGGRFATSDLNDLYRRVINRNNRLKRLLDLGAPDIIVRNEKRMLQEAVDALIDNGRRGRPVTGPGNRALKSLSDMLKGKQGRFRQNLLGKRVDYSGRSVIVVGPELKIYQCGLPKEMALELFKPFVMKMLVQNGLAHNIKSAKRMVERVRPEVWDVLEQVIKEHPVLLNRAPTLHRLGIQAFEPVLVEGRALKLHPLVCTAYNADFDGDQMAVHVPLSPEAQSEARFLMLSANNLLKPQDGCPVAVPTQDMILGSYYLTLMKPKTVVVTDPGDSEYTEGEKVNFLSPDEKGRLGLFYVNQELEAAGKKPAQYTEKGGFAGEKGEGKSFSSFTEAKLAYENGEVELHAPIRAINVKEKDGEKVSKLIDTSVGRIIFNENIPQDLGFVDRSVDENFFKLEVDFLADKKALGKIIDKCIKSHGVTETAVLLDIIKALGYKFSTRGAITISVSDMVIPEEKKAYLSQAEEEIEKIEKMFKRGVLTDEERYTRVIKTWEKTVSSVTKALMDNLDEFNPIYMMANSGARGSVNQIRQLAGMRGLMANTSGRTIEIPIRASFREGLNVLEYYISTHGARKGLTDTALRTADSGYLTRRLVDVSQEVIIRKDDCGTKRGITVSAISDGKRVIETLADRLVGRVPVEDVVDTKTGEVLAKANEMISEDTAKAIEDAGITEVLIRSVLGCQSKLGVCAHCYGANLASGQMVDIGEAVGIIAAQSIGEPGTQLTMRTFHTGGVAGDDITQGLPRVEELFEARKPKGLAIIADHGGKVSISETKRKREVTITDDEEGFSQTYLIPYGSRLKVSEGDVLKAGDELTEGSINPQDLLRIKGAHAVQQYLIQEVQKVYRLQGVDISDKHIEVIVRQMMRKVRVEESGETTLLAGTMEDRLAFEEIVNNAVAEGKQPPVAKDVILGITKASLATDSFLSAASFQETTKVLTDAAIHGKIDPLIGLKENVIIGKLIPAGTGMSRYRDIEIETEIAPEKNDLTI